MNCHWLRQSLELKSLCQFGNELPVWLIRRRGTDEAVRRNTGGRPTAVIEYPQGNCSGTQSEIQQHNLLDYSGLGVRLVLFLLWRVWWSLTKDLAGLLGECLKRRTNWQLSLPFQVNTVSKKCVGKDSTCLKTFHKASACADVGLLGEHLEPTTESENPLKESHYNQMTLTWFCNYFPPFTRLLNVL